MWSEIKFQGLILREKPIFKAFCEFLRQSPRTATCGVLNFTDQVITLNKCEFSDELLTKDTNLWVPFRGEVSEWLLYVIF